MMTPNAFRLIANVPQVLLLQGLRHMPVMM